MNTSKNIGIIEYFKRYGLTYGILRAAFTKWPIHYVDDYENKKILYYRIIKKKIEKKYKNTFNNDPAGLQFNDKKYENPVWVYWKQGENNMPKIVRRCIQSIKTYVKDQVILLTDENISDYIQFPDYINEKLLSGTMSIAAYSDLLRFSLLEHYGGTWIDSTVFLTGPLPNYITDSDLFAYQDRFGLIENPALMSIWILHCRSGNKVIRQTRNLAFEYWKKHSHVMEYLSSNIILTIVLENNPEEMKTISYANSDYCRLLLNSLGDEYDPKQIDHIMTLSCVHKLSYKLLESVLSDDKNVYHIITKKV